MARPMKMPRTTRSPRVVSQGLSRTKTSGRALRETCEVGAWGTCVGEVLPTDEVCDGQDQDCDGTVDEGFSDSDVDGICDEIDVDVDGDGIVNSDSCPPFRTLSRPTNPTIQPLLRMSLRP